MSKRRCMHLIKHGIHMHVTKPEGICRIKVQSQVGSLFLEPRFLFVRYMNLRLNARRQTVEYEQLKRHWIHETLIPKTYL